MIPRRRIAVCDLLMCWPPDAGAFVDVVNVASYLSRHAHVLLVLPRIAAFFRHRRNTIVDRTLAKYSRFFLRGAVEGDFSFQIKYIDFSGLDFNPLRIAESYLKVLSEFGPDRTFIANGWHLKAHLAKSLAPFMPILRIYAHEVLCTKADGRFFRRGKACLRNYLRGGAIDYLGCLVCSLSFYAVCPAVRWVQEYVQSRAFSRGYIEVVEAALTHARSVIVVGGRRFPIVGSRGCPYNCSFCVSPAIWKRRVRWRSPENIVDEMEYSKARFGIDQFHFWDDNLLLDRKHILALAEEILKRNLKVKWVGLSRASHVAAAEDLMPILARAGLIGMEIGIESANPSAYQIVGKNETLENLTKACEIQKKYGIFPMYTYMSFLPGDTVRGAYEQAKFMDRLLSGLPRYRYFHHLPFDIYIGQTCTPRVETRMHEDVLQLGRPMWENEEDFHHNSTCFLPHSLLEDVPIRMAEELTLDDRAFCVIVSYAAVADFLSYDSVFQKIRNVAAFNHLLDNFWRRCNGEKSILDLGEDIHRECGSGLSLNDVLRFLAASAVTLAQTGVLDSRSARDMAPMERKRIRYRYLPLYKWMLQVSQLYGKITGNLRSLWRPTALTTRDGWACGRSCP